MADQDEELDGEQEEAETPIPEIWRYADPPEGGSLIGKIVKYLNGKEEEELLEELKKPNPGTGQSLLMWAVLQQKFVLVEWLIKKTQRAAFVFGEKETAIYDKFVEKRKEREQEEKERLEALAENGEDEEPEEEREPPPPIHELVIAEYADDETIDKFKIRAIGELGVYDGQRHPADSAKTGLGQALYPNGDCYIGEYQQNKRHGVGCYWWASTGEIYIGSWSGNHRDGNGRMLHPDGGKYYGSWRMDEKSGKGRYTYPTGDTYAGDWVNGVRQGQGTYTVASDLSAFIGVFDKGEFTTGEWRLAGGVRYYGAFTDFKPTGKGVFLHKYGQEGAFTQDGEYINGEWNPVNIRKAGATGEAVSFAAQIQGRYVMLRPQKGAQLSLMSLVRVANFAPFDAWVKKLREGVGPQVVDLTVDSIVWKRDSKLIHSATLTVTAANPSGDTEKYPVVLMENSTVVAPIVTCEGDPPLVVHLEVPRPGLGSLAAPVLIEVSNSQKYDDDHFSVLASLGLDVAQGTTVNVNKIAGNAAGYCLQPGFVSSAFDVVLFTQEVTKEFYDSLPERLANAGPAGGFTIYACSQLSGLTAATPSLSSFTALRLLRSLEDEGKLPVMTVNRMRPPTPPPPVAEERPELPAAIPEEVLEAPKEEDEEE